MCEIFFSCSAGGDGTGQDQGGAIALSEDTDTAITRALQMWGGLDEDTADSLKRIIRGPIARARLLQILLLWERFALEDAQEIAAVTRIGTGGVGLIFSKKIESTMIPWKGVWDSFESTRVKE